MNLKFYQNEDRYSDGDVENDILAMVKENKSIQDIPPWEVKYPIIYHLSETRENILSWYPFSKEETILEVGAGCGAITGLLCRKVRHVTSVDLSKRRSDINYARNKKYDNLDIYVGNLNDMIFEEKFDYIVLNGVLEYAISFTDSETPYEDFLLQMSKFLKYSGKIIISIENRLGLKYFSGAAEDHTAILFSGLNEYQHIDFVRTFSKTEIETLLESVNFKNYKFYYPYPDYKFPIEIFTEDTFEENEYGKAYPNYDGNQWYLFDENKVAYSLVKEGVMATFSNSFLIVASREELNESHEILYAKINNDRKDSFRIITTIEKVNGRKQAVKSPLCSEAEKHIKEIYNHSQERGEERFGYLKGEITDRGVVYPYLESGNLNQEVLKLIKEKRVDRIVEIMQEIVDGYLQDSHLTSSYHTAEFQNVFGNTRLDMEMECINHMNIDLICDNLYRSEKGMTAIDCEWIFDFAIPIHFIIWRTINDIYAKYDALHGLEPIADMFEKFGIDQRQSYVFWCWSVYFSDEYVKNRQLEKYKAEIPKVDVQELYRLCKDKQPLMIESSLYYDDGSGYSEEKRIKKCVELVADTFHISYDLHGVSGIKKLRFDPLEGTCCICSLIQNATSFVPINSSGTCKQGDLFLTTDPMYEMNIQGENIKNILVQGHITKLSPEEVEKHDQIILQQENDENNENDEKMQDVILDVQKNNREKELPKKRHEKRIKKNKIKKNITEERH